MSDNENKENNNEDDNEEGEEVDDEDQEKNNSEENKMSKEERDKLIADYKDKENIYDLIIKNNDELKNKITLTTSKYDELIKRIEEKQNSDVEYQLKLKINAMEKEIEAYQTENKNYKKKIEQKKNTVKFKNIKNKKK